MCQEPSLSLIFFQRSWSACYPAYIFLCCFGDVSKREIPFSQNLSPHPKGDCSVLWPLLGPWDHKRSWVQTSVVNFFYNRTYYLSFNIESFFGGSFFSIFEPFSFGSSIFFNFKNLYGSNTKSSSFHVHITHSSMLKIALARNFTTN